MPYSTNHGVKIYYEASGSGVPLVLIHANPFDHGLWVHQIRHFSAVSKVIALDLRGYGRSDKPTHAFGLNDMADDVLSVCRAERVKQAIVMGASVGSAIAMWLAIEHPRLCTGLVLVGGSSKGGERIDDRIRGYTEKGVHTYRREHLAAMFAPPFRHSDAGRALLDALEKSNRELSGESIAQIFRARAKLDLSPHLPGLKLPTLVINGEFDHSLPAGVRTAQLIPGAVHRIVLGTGHACCIENPAVFNTLVEAFLRDRGLLA